MVALAAVLDEQGCSSKAWDDALESQNFANVIQAVARGTLGGVNARALRKLLGLLPVFDHVRVNYDTTCERVLKSIGPYRLDGSLLDSPKHGQKFGRAWIKVKPIDVCANGVNSVHGAQTENKCSVSSTLECLFYIRKNPRILDGAVILACGPRRRGGSGFDETYYHRISRKGRTIYIVSVDHEGGGKEGEQTLILGRPWK